MIAPVSGPPGDPETLLGDGVAGAGVADADDDVDPDVLEFVDDLELVELVVPDLLEVDPLDEDELDEDELDELDEDEDDEDELDELEEDEDELDEAPVEQKVPTFWPQLFTKIC